MSSVDQAILLCGGLGTRLRDMFPDIPKALVPVAGKPIVHRQIDWLRELGVDRVHIAAGHKADLIQTWRDETPELHDIVTVSVEPERLGTGGGTRFAVDTIPAQERYLILNGDSLLPGLDLAPLLAALEPPRTMAMAITRIEDAARYGTVELRDDMTASAFHEKTGVTKPGHVNAGIYYMTRSVIERIPNDRPSSIEKDLFPILASEAGIACVSYPPPLLDMGTPDGFDAMTQFLLETQE